MDGGKPLPKARNLQPEDVTEPAIERRQLELAQTGEISPGTPEELGHLHKLLTDSTVSEIMINDLRNVTVERAGKLIYTGYHYRNLAELDAVVQALLRLGGQTMSTEAPFADFALPDGSRVNIVGPPVAAAGPCVTIRKRPSRRMGIEDLMKTGMLDRRLAYFLNACVVGRLNLLISGGTSCGKTTLLNVLLQFVPKGERLVAIEDTPELSIKHFNSVKMQTRVATAAEPAISARQLVNNALRMRPDRIVIGECRGPEAFDMLQAMNTGHAGSMTSVHSNTPRDALGRIETLCMMTGVELPLSVIRNQMKNALDLIVHIRRLRDGKRRVTHITEVTGMEGDTMTLQDIFSWEPDTDTFKSLGSVPTFLDQLREHGVEIPATLFQ